MKATRTLKILNRFGLHARPAALVVETASKYDCEVTLMMLFPLAFMPSLLSVMLLAAEPESEIELLAEGPQATEAVDALDELFKARFHEDDA